MYYQKSKSYLVFETDLFMSKEKDKKRKEKIVSREETHDAYIIKVNKE